MHGDRGEYRELLVSTALVHDWLHCQQVLRLVRTVTQNGRTTTEVAHSITSLTPERVSPRQLLAMWRGHWRIENSLRWVRDVTFGEDQSQIRTGAAPQIMAAIRNIAITSSSAPAGPTSPKSSAPTPHNHNDSFHF